MQHDAVVGAEEARRLLLRCIGSGTAAALAMDFDFPVAVGMERVMDRDHMHGIEMRALAMGRVNPGGTRELVIQLESALVLGTMVREIQHVDMEKVRALGRMHDTERVLEMQLCCTDAEAVVLATLLCDTAVVGAALAILRVGDTGTEQAAQENVLLRAIRVWMVELGKRSASRVTATAPCRRPGIEREGQATLHEAGSAVLAALGTRLCGTAAEAVVLATRLGAVLVTLLLTVAGRHVCARTASRAAVLATRLSRHVSGTAAAGASLCEHGTRAC